MKTSTIFTDSSWKLSDVVFPNLLAWKDHDAITPFVVVVSRLANRRGRDYALSKAGLERVIGAEREGRVTEGLVSLWDQSADRKRHEFVGEEKASVVHERLRNVPPQEGKWGPFWWITADFQPVVSAAARYDPDAPF